MELNPTGGVLMRRKNLDIDTYRENASENRTRDKVDASMRLPANTIS